MKKSLSIVSLVLVCCLILSSCIKNSPYVTSVSPSMSATIGSYNFIGSTTWISTLDTQVHDSTTTLVITGISSDVAFPVDRIQLTITKYKGVTGTFGIVVGDATAYYYHNGIYYTALGGIVSITHVYSDRLVGYFNFINSNSTLNVTNGAFTVLKP